MKTLQIVEFSTDQQFLDLIRKFKKDSPELIAFLVSIAAAYISEYPEKTQETEELTDDIIQEFPVERILIAMGIVCSQRGKLTVPGGEELIENTIAYFKRYCKRKGITAATAANYIKD